ncbi:hypothetical protein Ciccas_001000 [Cichlidogyrus casuarinus]|uniref:Uncharacterized protein n=1 Tax=Cichlidogyrus casuarinus TaxID=1844966 RepID=A0ABD2QPB2_9PLAT
MRLEMSILFRSLFGLALIGQIVLSSPTGAPCLNKEECIKTLADAILGYGDCVNVQISNMLKNTNLSEAKAATLKEEKSKMDDLKNNVKNTQANIDQADLILEYSKKMQTLEQSTQTESQNYDMDSCKKARQQIKTMEQLAQWSPEAQRLGAGSSDPARAAEKEIKDNVTKPKSNNSAKTASNFFLYASLLFLAGVFII